MSRLVLSRSARHNEVAHPRLGKPAFRVSESQENFWSLTTKRFGVPARCQPRAHKEIDASLARIAPTPLGGEPDGLSRAQPRGLSLEKLRKNLQVRWDEQRKVYGKSRRFHRGQDQGLAGRGAAASCALVPACGALHSDGILFDLGNY